MAPRSSSPAPPPDGPVSHKERQSVAAHSLPGWTGSQRAEQTTCTRSARFFQDARRDQTFTSSGAIHGGAATDSIWMRTKRPSPLPAPSQSPTLHPSILTRSVRPPSGKRTARNSAAVVDFSCWVCVPRNVLHSCCVLFLCGAMKSCMPYLDTASLNVCTEFMGFTVREEKINCDMIS